jgi:hypothetical protein
MYLEEKLISQIKKKLELSITYVAKVMAPRKNALFAARLLYLLRPLYSKCKN